MNRLNHINLQVPDVPGSAAFFERCFGFRVMEQRGQGKFAVMLGEDGFVLTLMHGKPEVAGYPPTFHVGFLKGTEAEVNVCFERIRDAGFAQEAPAKIERGGPPVYGFYHRAPGGVVVEVSARLGS
jgi:catechol 2,3-dioxygenase-like lactoylglutathione lyase family enzyme